MSELTLVIGNKNYSSWSLRPWIYMKNKRIKFTEKRIALYMENTTKLLEPYFSGYKVPVLIDDNLVIWDSLAIFEYLAEKYPDCNGWPNNPNARATARSVSAEMHSSFSALRNELPMNCRKKFSHFTLSSEVLYDIERIKEVWRYCKKTYGQKGPWLFGEFCIADAMFAPVVIRFTGYGVPLEGLEKDYVQTVINNTFLAEWIEAGKQEKEILEIAEVKI
ncbi:MAG: glutathione S-transferase family protein [Desulfobacterales bacterium]|uniref:Glutathione S-transferase family protein n=1 Tax=Candidatus Desulfatibia vada TaxID=2841696 RepID=A0A8J6TMJ0_9BACT|nr:glutathione S-transferase family protein [Candidatus Desulfatibia vada]